MSRSAVWHLLTTDPDITEMGFSPENMYGNNVVDREKRGGKFLVLVWGAITPQERISSRDTSVRVQELSVWVHEPKYSSNDFTDINETLERVKHLLEATTHLPGTDGWILSHADWRGDSPDLTDDVLNTITRNSTFRVASRKG